MKRIYYWLIGIAILGASCGKEEEVVAEFSVSGSVELLDSEFWPQHQKVVFGVFEQGERNPFLSVELLQPAGRQLEFKLQDIPEGEYEVKLYISENVVSKYELVSYGSIRVHNDVVLEERACWFISFERVQKQVLNSCLQCHGGSLQTAAGLNLYENHSYDLLVKQSATNSLLNRVEPGNADSSFVVQVLKKQDLPFDHSASSTASQGDIQLIVDWINQGAEH